MGGGAQEQTDRDNWFETTFTIDVVGITFIYALHYLIIWISSNLFELSILTRRLDIVLLDSGLVKEGVWSKSGLHVNQQDWLAYIKSIC